MVCAFICNDGYVLEGTTSCHAGSITSIGRCRPLVCNEAVDCRYYGLDFVDMPAVLSDSHYWTPDVEKLVVSYTLEELLSMEGSAVSVTTKEVCDCTCSGGSTCGSIAVNDQAHTVMFDSHCGARKVLEMSTRLPFNFTRLAYAFEVEAQFVDGVVASDNWQNEIRTWEDVRSVCESSDYVGYVLFGTDREVLTTSGGSDGVGHSHTTTWSRSYESGESWIDVESSDTIRMVVSQRGGATSKDLELRGMSVRFSLLRSALSRDCAGSKVCAADCTINTCCRPLMGPCEIFAAECSARHFMCPHKCRQDFEIPGTCSHQTNPDSPGITLSEREWRLLSEEVKHSFEPASMSPFAAR